MKKILIFLMALCLCACSGKASSSAQPVDVKPSEPAAAATPEPAVSVPEWQQSDLSQKVIQTDELGGALYLGTAMNSERTAFLKTLEEDGLTEKYPFLTEAPIIVSSVEPLFYDVFLLVPRDGDVSVACNDTMSGSVLYRSEDGVPLFLFCSNTAEDYMEVSIVKGERSVTFFPEISEEDDSILLPNGGGICDLSGLYTYVAFDQAYFDILYFNVADLSGLLEGGAVLKRNGRITLDEKECLCYALGTESEDLFTAERYYAVALDRSILYEYDAAGDVWQGIIPN